jgi:membrane protein YdbS with pleckstrin-like domain
MKKIMTYREKRQQAVREQKIFRFLWIVFFPILLLTGLVVAFVNVKYYGGHNHAMTQISFWLFLLIVTLGITTSLVQLFYWADRIRKKREGQIVFNF